MTPPRRPEDVTEEEVDRTWAALLALPRSIPIGMDKDCLCAFHDVRAAIASGLLVPPPRERTQMEKDYEGWLKRLSDSRGFTTDDAHEFHRILCHLFPAANAAGVTY